MKKKLFEVFVCMLLMGTCFIVAIDTISAGQDGDYTYTVSNGEATITGYTGSTKVIKIPSTLGGFPTVAIGDGAFYFCDNCFALTSVTIPDSVTTIGYQAFRFCSSLTSVTIPSSVTFIGAEAFNFCFSLKSVTIPDSVTTIGVSAFDSCYTLASVTIGNSVITIGDYAFSYSDLASVTIPNSVISIGKYAFYGCSALASVTIGNSVITIGDYAFSYSDLTSVAIPNSVTTIGNYAFGSCESLTAINVDAANVNYASVYGVMYSKDIATLIQYPAGKAGAFNIPGNITTIGNGAFYDCTFLTSVTIPHSITTIGRSAFYSCSNLTSITFLGFVAPTTVGEDWITGTPEQIRGHAYATSNFPDLGQKWYNLTMGTYIPGPPVIGTPFPTNDSTGNLLSLTWSILISDPNSNQFSWTIECNNGQKNSDASAGSGTKSLSLSGLAYSTAYTLWVNATDLSGSGLYTRRWYRFTTRAIGNNPPVLSSPSPMNGSTGNLLSLSWSIPISDLEGNAFSWTIQCSNGQVTSGIDATNGTKTLSLSGLAYLTTYRIWVNATDPTGGGNYTRKWFTFTTRSSGEGGGDEPSNIQPIADVSAGEPYQGFVNTEITFDGSNSSDFDGNITRWFWVFGDTTNGTGKTISHSYSKAGTYIVILTVTDNEGATNTNATTCIISETGNRPPTTPIITGPINGTKNTLYTFTTLSTDADNDTVRYYILWGDETSYANISTFLLSGTPFTGSHSWAIAGRYNVTATVTDNQTESFSNITIYIDTKEIVNLGYLIDNDGDGIYDTFYSYVSKKATTVQKKDGNYNIDSDGNGDWDYTFDETNGLISYQESKTPGFELVYVLYAIVVAMFLCGKKRNI